jgi:predicted DNA-binding protein
MFKRNTPMSASAENLIRKQVMLSKDNIEKLDKLSKKRGTSAAEIVRLSIDSYNPDSSDFDDSELIEIVSEKLQEAIKDTANTRKRLNKALKALELKGIK